MGEQPASPCGSAELHPTADPTGQVFRPDPAARRTRGQVRVPAGSFAMGDAFRGGLSRRRRRTSPTVEDGHLTTAPVKSHRANGYRL